MTPEQAAENAAKVLEQARQDAVDLDMSAALVAVADGWTRLHTALANAPKTIEPAPGEPAEIASLPVEVRQLVHAVDAMRDQWVEADTAQRRALCQRVHEAHDAVWEMPIPPEPPKPI